MYNKYINNKEKCSPLGERDRQCEQVIRINLYLNSSYLFCEFILIHKLYVVNSVWRKNGKILFRYGYRYRISRYGLY